MIPPEFTGAWRRHSLTLGDGEPHEPQRVVWIQADAAFADLRLPVAAGADTNCFAGTTTWDAPRLHWHHDVGLDPPGSADEGDVEWDGDALVERGVFVIEGEPTPYVEVWRRDPGSEGQRLAMEVVEASGAPVKGRFVQAGDHSLSVIDRRAAGGGVDACYHRRLAGGLWEPVFGLGNGTAGPPVAAGSATVGDMVEHVGLRWRVAEATRRQSVP